MYEVDLTNDFVFRYIFGNEKNSDILSSFVNAILQANHLTPVRKVTPVTPFLPVRERDNPQFELSQSLSTHYLELPKVTAATYRRKI